MRLRLGGNEQTQVDILRDTIVKKKFKRHNEVKQWMLRVFLQKPISVGLFLLVVVKQNMLIPLSRQMRLQTNEVSALKLVRVDMFVSNYAD